MAEEYPSPVPCTEVAVEIILEGGWKLELILDGEADVQRVEILGEPFSVFLGDDLSEIFESIADGKKAMGKSKEKILLEESWV